MDDIGYKPDIKYWHKVTLRESYGIPKEAEYILDMEVDADQLVSVLDTVRIQNEIISIEESQMYSVYSIKPSF